MLHIEFKEKEKKKKEHKSKKDKEKEKAEEKEKEEENEEMIFFSPSQEKITESLLKPFEMLRDLTNSFNKLEPELVPFLYIEKSVSY